MPPIYSGSADEWCYISTDTTGSAVKSVEIIIDNFESQMKEVIELKSHQFTLKDTLWHIGLKPDQDGERKGYVGIFFHNDNKEDLTIKVNVEIGGNRWGEKESTIAAEKARGCAKLLSQQQCKDVLIDGKLKIKVEMKLLKKEVTVIHGKGTSSIPIPDIGSITLKIFEDKSFTDFRIVCKGKSFACHKAFLMARSAVFKTMIESNMKEAKEGSVEFENCTETVVGSFVKYFYTGNVEESILKENVTSFLDLGEKYDMAGLKAMAEQVMIASLDKDNMLSFFQAGDLFKGEKIKAAAKIFLRQNRSSLVEQEGWKDALTDRHLVLELLEFFSMD